MCVRDFGKKSVSGEGLHKVRGVWVMGYDTNTNFDFIQSLKKG